MSETFQVPAKPWRDADIKLMMANRAVLDEETLAELGLVAASPAPEVVEPVVETPVETPVVEETTEEVIEEVEEAPVEEETETVDNSEETPAE